jgi:putative Ca2+/H+ antiporter (TMEM165/GDT1 family)
MDWHIFFSTFALVFLAELGDKTQLTVLAQSSVHGRLAVCLAACLALCASTLLAVLFGGVLNRFLPPRAIRLLAGALFILFGLLLVIPAIRHP